MPRLQEDPVSIELPDRLSEGAKYFMDFTFCTGRHALRGSSRIKTLGYCREPRRQGDLSVDAAAERCLAHPGRTHVMLKSRYNPAPAAFLPQAQPGPGKGAMNRHACFARWHIDNTPCRLRLPH